MATAGRQSCTATPASRCPRQLSRHGRMHNAKISLHVLEVADQLRHLEIVHECRQRIMNGSESAEPELEVAAPPGVSHELLENASSPTWARAPMVTEDPHKQIPGGRRWYRPGAHAGFLK